jgi:hypothetical protein
MESSSIIAIITLLTAIVLRRMGRDWGIPKLWVSDTHGPETSQALADPYIWTHALHGIAFYFLFGRFGATGLLVSHGLECAWELMENTERIIQRYRAETISLGYNGDSVLNSVGDICAMLAGYAFASSVPWYVSLVLFALVEVGMAWTYKDNLSLNILMLLYPLKGVKDWQQRRESFTSENADLDAELLEYAKVTTQTVVNHLEETYAENTIARNIVRGWKGEVINGNLGEALAAYEVPTGRLFIDISNIKKEGWVTEERMNGIILHELAHAHAGGHTRNWLDAQDFLFRVAIVDLKWKIDIDSDSFDKMII